MVMFITQQNFSWIALLAGVIRCSKVLDVVQVVASDDDRALHLGGDAHALQNGTADAHIPGRPQGLGCEGVEGVGEVWLW